jgi:hypothetical protein
MATSTIDTDTELSAVNSILGSIGQAPVTNLDLTNNPNPEISFIYNILTEVNKDVQNEGWHFNTEYHIKLSPEDTTGYITLPNNTLQYDIHDGLTDKTVDVVVRNGRLYDLVQHTDVFTNDIYVDAVTLYPFADLPNPFQRYITYRSAVRAATQLVSNPVLGQALVVDENKARATCVEYECKQGDHSFLGHPHEGRYKSFRPYNALRR